MTKAKLQEDLDLSSGNMSTLEKIADDNGGMEKEGSISSASTEVDSKMKELNSKLEKESFADEFDSQLALSTLKMRAGEISEAYLLIRHDQNDALNGILLERLTEVDGNIQSCDQALAENDWPMLVERCDKALEEADLFPKLHAYKALGLLMLQNEKEALMELNEAISSLVKKFIGEEEDLPIIEDLVKFREAISTASKEQCATILEDEVDQLKQLDEEKAARAQCWRAVEKLYEPLIKEKMDRIKLLKGYRHQLYHQSSSVVEEELDPFSLVADELSLLSNKLRAMVVAKFPKLAFAAEYFFKRGVEGKQFRPTILLLMATALNVRVPEALAAESADIVSSELRVRQRGIAEITEMIHVASLLHDDVLDDADTRRGVGSINFVMDNKISVLAGDFLLSRACVALAALKNTEVVSLLATVVEHLVTGETMQMTSITDQRHSMDYYMEKTYYKTASLISNSCKAIALLAGQSAEVAMLAFGYGKNLGLALQLIDDVLDFTGTSASLREGSLSDIKHGIITAPIIFAMEEFPQLRKVVDQLEKDPTSVDTALEYLGKSNGIQRTRELAIEHANLAAAAIGSLPETDDEDVKRSRRALIDLTHRVISRNK